MAEKKKSEEQAEQADAPKQNKSAPEAEEQKPGDGMNRLYRSTTNRMLAGICGGIGEYFNIDPTLVRILFAISVFFGGFGLIAYVVGWIIIPEGSRDVSGKPAPTVSSTPVFGLLIGLALILIGLGMVFDRMRYWYYLPDWLDPFFSVQTFFALILIAIGIFFIFYMFRNGSERKAGEGAAGVFEKKSLFRSKTDKKISGVCGGIGEYFRIDPTIIRVFWIVVTLSTGFVPGIVIYFVLAIAIPEQPVIQEDVS